MKIMMSVVLFVSLATASLNNLSKFSLSVNMRNGIFKHYPNKKFLK